MTERQIVGSRRISYRAHLCCSSRILANARYVDPDHVHKRRRDAIENRASMPKHRALAVLPWTVDVKSLYHTAIYQQTRRLCNAALHRALASGRHLDYAMRPSIALWLYTVPHWSTEPPNDRDRAACIKPLESDQASRLGYTAREH